MVRAMATATSLSLAVALAAGACTPAQAPAVRASGKLMALGGVAGIVGSAFATNLSDKAYEMMLGFEVISAVGVISYAYAELTWPREHHVQEPIEERNHRWATILTERAAGAARQGRCARVRRLEAKVQKYDSVVHDAVLMKDPEILRCLGTPAAPGSPTGEPAERPPLELPPGSLPAGPPPAELPPAEPAPGSPAP